MTKVKILEHNVVEKETDYEYPIYLHFQDEENLCDEFIMITENNQLLIKDDFNGITIKKSDNIIKLEQRHLDNDQISKENFNEILSFAIEQINKSL